MKRVILVFSILLIFLSGCSLQDTSSTQINNAQLYSYRDDEVVLTYKVNGFRLYIDVYDIDHGGKVDLRFQKDQTLIAKNNKEGIFESEVTVEKNEKKRYIDITEKVTYYDEANRELNFTYDRKIRLKYTMKNGLYSFGVTNLNDAFKWDLFANIRSIQESSVYGIYNMSEVLNIIALLTYIMIFIMVMIKIVLQKRLLLLKERKFRCEEPLEWIIAFEAFWLAIMVIFQGEPPIIEIVLHILLGILIFIRFVITMLKMKDALAYERNKKIA